MKIKYIILLITFVSLVNFSQVVAQTSSGTTTDINLSQTTELPYKNSNFNGYSFPMKSFKTECGARCDIDLDNDTATIGWMCTGVNN